MPHIKRTVRHSTRRFTHFMSDMYPNTTRPTVLEIPTIDINQAVSLLLNPRRRPRFAKKMYATMEPLSARKVETAKRMKTTSRSRVHRLGNCSAPILRDANLLQTVLLWLPVWLFLHCHQAAVTFDAVSLVLSNLFEVLGAEFVLPRHRAPQLR